MSKLECLKKKKWQKKVVEIIYSVIRHDVTPLIAKKHLHRIKMILSEIFLTYSSTAALPFLKLLHSFSGRISELLWLFDGR